MNAPDQHAVMALLNWIKATYSWEDFRPILEDPARLATLVKTKTLGPDQITLDGDEEMEALEFWNTDLDKPDREKIRTALETTFGPTAANLLPDEESVGWTLQ